MFNSGIPADKNVITHVNKKVTSKSHQKNRVQQSGSGNKNHIHFLHRGIDFER